jgi:hypothetical protein
MEGGDKIMALIAMLTVELGGVVTDDKRAAFSAELAQFEWEPVEPLKSTWCGAYEDDITEDDAAEMAMEDVADAAEAAGIDSFDACLHFGPNEPSLFSDQDYEEAGDEPEEDKE